LLRYFALNNFHRLEKTFNLIFIQTLIKLLLMLQKMFKGENIKSAEKT
jgi:hypothetical protein